jgi:hypothetical protein
VPVLVAATALACSGGRPRTGELRVLVDSTAARGALEVLALPFNPATLPRASAGVAPGVAAPGPRGDSLSAYYALRDSALALDAAFQRTRAELNREALSFRGADRRTRAYAERYATFERRAAEAEATRAARDRLRERVATWRAKLARSIPPEEPAAGGAARPRRAVDSAARATGREPVRARIERGAATLRLPAGDWWITLARGDGSVLTPAVPRQMRGTARDTLRWRSY